MELSRKRKVAPKP